MGLLLHPHRHKHLVMLAASAAVVAPCTWLLAVTHLVRSAPGQSALNNPDFSCVHLCCRVAAASQAGPSRMAACAGGGSSSNSRFCPSAAEALDHQACSSWHQQQQQPALRQLIGGHSAAAAPAAGLMGSSDCSLQESDSGFQLRSRLSTIDDADTDIQLRRSIGSVLLQRWHRGDEGGAVDDWCCAAGGLAAAAGDDDRGDTLTHTTADAAAEGSALQWFEEEMLQVGVGCWAEQTG